MVAPCGYTAGFSWSRPRRIDCSHATGRTSALSLQDVSMKDETLQGHIVKRTTLRVSVLQLTRATRNRLLQNNNSLNEEPVFSGHMSGWKLRRRYLAVFVDGSAVVGLGIVIPGNMAGTYERRIGVED